MIAPVFHLNPMGRLANLMIQYMVALKFRHFVPECRIAGIRIPEWGIHHPSIDPPGPVAMETREQRIDLPALADRMKSGAISGVQWSGFGQRMENFLPREVYAGIFRSPFGRAMGFGAEYLVCPIRAEDILDGHNRNYTLTPVEFYRDIVEMTGLRPVFIGQTAPNLYTNRIRAAFPNAIYREPQSDPLVDFETIRQSHNVVVPVSTYAWLATWLSSEVRNAYMAVNGLLSPMQYPEVDLIPFGDERFRLFLFPINYAVELEQHAALHRRIAPYWRLVPHELLRRQMMEAPRFPRTVNCMLSCFDEAFYLSENQDVGAVAMRYGREIGRVHYIHHGFTERRSPLRFDPFWYANTYPLAGYEVAQGDYADFAHHYAAVGRARGYLPHAP